MGRGGARTPELARHRAAPGRRRWPLVAVAAVVVVAVLVVGAAMVLGADDEGGVVLEPAAASPDEPVLDVAAAEPDEPIDVAGAAGDAPEMSSPDEPVLLAGRTVSGTEPGVYAGGRDRPACDVERLTDVLTGDNADAGAADDWFAALDRNVDDRERYLDELTGVHLRYDTRVTAHGADGPYDAVLQAGTAVLVDPFGVPRVRCAGGMPLDEPAPAPSGTSASGSLDAGRAAGADPWDGFDPAAVVVVVGSGAGVDAFDLAGATGGEPFTRPAGTDGERDRGVFSPGEDDDCDDCRALRISIATVGGTPARIAYVGGGRPAVALGSATELVWRDGTADPGTFTYTVTHDYETYMALDPDTTWTQDPAVYDDPRHDDEDLVIDATRGVVDECVPGDVTVTVTVDDVAVQTTTEAVPCGDGTTFTYELT